MDKLQSTFSHALKQFFTMELIDVIDILIVTAIIFFVIKFISDKRAGKLALGICTVILFVLISEIFQMSAINYIFSNIMQVGIILIVILFQSEIRSVLEKIGGASHDLKILSSSKDGKVSGSKRIAEINTLCDTVQELSKECTGALIVIEHKDTVDELLKNITVVNADITKPLIKNIFYNKAPLHDGAMIIRNFRVYYAGCVLPLSYKDDINEDLGTRHRAAIGMSENSDAFVIVVSEETGTISAAVEGTLRRNYDYNTLKKALMDYLFDENKNSNASDANGEGKDGGKIKILYKKIFKNKQQ